MGDVLHLDNNNVLESNTIIDDNVMENKTIVMDEYDINSSTESYSEYIERKRKNMSDKCIPLKVNIL